MDRVNYFDEFFLGKIDYDTLLEKVSKSMNDGISYVLGAIDCMEYMYNYYKGAEPIYPSEMAGILDRFFEDIGMPEDFRKDIVLTEETEEDRQIREISEYANLSE